MSIENQVAKIESTVEGFGTQLQAIQEAVNSMAGKTPAAASSDGSAVDLTGIEDAVAKVQAQSEANGTSLSSILASLGDFKSQLSQLQTDIEAVKAAIADPSDAAAISGKPAEEAGSELIDPAAKTYGEGDGTLQGDNPKAAETGGFEGGQEQPESNQTV